VTDFQVIRLDRLIAANSTLYIDIPKGLTKQEVRKNYPNLIKHLEEFKESLESRYQYVEDAPFWEWSFRRSEKFFKNGQHKVFVPCKERITNRQNIRFSLVPKDVIATQDVTAIAPKDSTKETAEYLAAYLCLTEISNWIRIRGLIKGGIAEFSERPLASIPFREINWSSKTEINIHNEITEIVKLTFKKKLDKEKAISTIHKLFEQLGLP
jgi:adenine-specific DNA-methyltransferase